jgi:hypothetical protein
VLALGRWASGSPSFPRGAEMGPDSLVLALKATFDPAKADGLVGTYELRLGEIPFNISVDEGGFEAARGRRAWTRCGSGLWGPGSWWWRSRRFRCRSSS